MCTQVQSIKMYMYYDNQSIWSLYNFTDDNNSFALDQI